MLLTNKLFLSTLLLASTLPFNAADDYNKQKIKENDSNSKNTGIVVSSDNKYLQYQNKRGVPEADSILASPHTAPGYLSANSLNGFTPITVQQPYTSTGTHLGPIYTAPQFYSKPYSFGHSYYKAPIVFPTAPSSYASLYLTQKFQNNPHFSYPQGNYITHQSTLPTYYPAIAAAHSHALPLFQQFAHPNHLHSTPIALQHHGLFATVAPTVYSNTASKYAASNPILYATSDIGHTYQPQPAYSIQSSIPITYGKEIIETVGPQVPESTAKPLTASAVSTIHHSDSGNSVSYSSVSRQSSTTKAPVSHVIPVAAIPVLPHSQYFPVSGSIKVGTSVPNYPQIPYSNGAIQYGTHLLHSSVPKGAYTVQQ